MARFKAPRRVKDAESRVVGKLSSGRKSAFERFPLVFTLLTTFGVVTTFYGFEHLVDKVHWLANNAYVSLIVGLIILVLTGSLYKKL